MEEVFVNDDLLFMKNFKYIKPFATYIKTMNDLNLNYIENIENTRQ